jgi:hypothetical protein
MGAIQYDEAARRWVLASGEVEYVMALAEDGTLRHRYFGPAAARRDASAADWLWRRGDVDDWGLAIATTRSWSTSTIKPRVSTVSSAAGR